jgi:hypothetical protein
VERGIEVSEEFERVSSILVEGRDEGEEQPATESARGRAGATDTALLGLSLALRLSPISGFASPVLVTH